MDVIGSHEPTLVVLSVLIAVAASYTALDIAGRARAATPRARPAWVAVAALCMGGGIWAMHFVGMLAYAIPGEATSYDVWLTGASLVAAVASTGLGLAATGGRLGWRGILVAGVLTGLGISAMHAIGMSAVRVRARFDYDVAWSSAAVAIAVTAATASLALSARPRTGVVRAAAATVMGLAVAGMHYVAMAGVSVVPCATPAPGAALGHEGLAAAVTGVTFVIFAAALAAAAFDRRVAAMAEREAEALRESGERLRSLYAKSPLPLHSIDADGLIESVSDAWLTLVGYGREEVVGRPFGAFLTPESAERCAGVDCEELMRVGALADRPYQLVASDGRVVDVLASGRVERDADGRFLRVLAGVTDVTERLRTEEALRQAQKIEAIGHLTGGVAHDFNNMLAIVLGNLGMLEKRLPPDDARAARLLDGAMLGARRGADLTKRLLAFARRQDLVPQAVRVPELVASMEDMLQRSLGPATRVETRFPPRLAPALVDGHQLEQAILNLAINARDAMPEGGLLTISATEAEAPRGLSGRGVLLSVADTGSGMDAATLARATEPFFTTKGVGKGTGLGLPMVHGLAAQSGGQLALRSQPGRGTTADLWLPAAEGATEAAPTEAPPASVPVACEGLSILAVDDDPLVLASTVAVLEDMGHAVVATASGTTALQALRAHLRSGEGFDLVVTDHMMPGMTGLQLAEAVRAMSPSMPILVVSGYAELPSGANAFPRLAKPFDAASLSAAVAGAVARAQGGGNVVPMRARADRAAVGGHGQQAAGTVH